MIASIFFICGRGGQPENCLAEGLLFVAAAALLLFGGGMAGGGAESEDGDDEGAEDGFHGGVCCVGLFFEGTLRRLFDAPRHCLSL